MSLLSLYVIAACRRCWAWNGGVSAPAVSRAGRDTLQGASAGEDIMRMSYELSCGSGCMMADDCMRWRRTPLLDVPGASDRVRGAYDVST